jgi:hypothetical protein
MGHGCGGKPAGKNRMSCLDSYDGFVTQLRAFMACAQTQAPAGAELDAEFNRLAAALFALQRQSVPIYAEFCAQRRVAAVEDWREIPALPAAAFKEYEVTSLPPDQRTRVFHSSGTTRHKPSRHFHNARSLALYEESLRLWFRRHFLDPQSENPQSAIRNPQLIVLTPPPAQAPHSSLAHMFDTVRPEFCGATFTGRMDGDGAWALDLERTISALQEAQSAREPVALLGTASAFVHLLDHCRASRTRFRLAAGSRALETGGYKGRGRAASKEELRQMMTRWLGIDESHIVSEYGMSELSSQAYDRAVAETGGDFRFPPWARARIISPETGREAVEGETGLVRVVDLANVWSTLAVQTEDLGARHGGGFELAGRAAGAAARGCSLMLRES